MLLTCYGCGQDITQSDADIGRRIIQEVLPDCTLALCEGCAEDTLDAHRSGIANNLESGLSAGYDL